LGLAARKVGGALFYRTQRTARKRKAKRRDV